MVNANAEITLEEKQALVLESYSDQIKFYAKVFAIDEDVLYHKLQENYDTLNIEANQAIDQTIIDYLFNLEKEDKTLFNNKLVPGNGVDKKYILSLIDYYCSIYSNVDFAIAASIAHIESGFRAKTMLKNNNIFGGMTKGKLISYKNIEYGILKYIKLLNDGYFTQGLTNIDTIGRKYNPVMENGVKKANPIWVKNVKSVLSKYQEYNDFINILELEEL